MNKIIVLSFKTARTVGLVLAVLATLWFGALVARAATIPVNSLSGGSSSTACTLRDAIVASNTDQIVGGCVAGSGSDTITFAVTGTILLTSGLPAINTSVDIAGPGAQQLTVERDQSAVLFRFLVISSTESAGSAVSISGLTFLHGQAFAGNGGAIRVNTKATFELTEVTFDGNSASAPGGAVFSSSPITITRSRFVDNVSMDGSGGAVFASDSTYVDRSVFVRNSANGYTPTATVGGGGALRLNGGPNVIVNSIFVGNVVTQAAVGGGAIRSAATLPTNIAHSVIVGNGPADGQSAVLATGAAQLRVVNTIVASYSVGILQVGTTSVLEDYNLYFDVGQRYSGTVPVGAHSITGDPLFVDSATGNFRIVGTSPAVDAGSDVGVAEDFDGASRPTGLRPDIGAFEYPSELGLTIKVYLVVVLR